jgi:FkbM family methyltransferase
MKLSSLAKAAKVGITPGAVTELRARSAALRRIGATRTGLKRGRWEPFLWNTNLTLLPRGELPHIHTIVDVGAYAGDWTAAVLKIADVHRAVAFEANPGVARQLECRFATEPRVRTVAAAAGPRAGTSSFHVTVAPTASSVLAPRTWRSAANLVVPMVTLDEELQDLDEISLLKVDVQGYEDAVFAGASATLSRTRWLLTEVNFIEKYDAQSMFDDVHRTLSDHGFTLRGMTAPENLRGTPSYADALYRGPDDTATE